jgi:hypothetical protein
MPHVEHSGLLVVPEGWKVSAGRETDLWLLIWLPVQPLKQYLRIVQITASSGLLDVPGQSCVCAGSCVKVVQGCRPWGR